MTIDMNKIREKLKQLELDENDFDPGFDSDRERILSEARKYSIDLKANLDEDYILVNPAVAVLNKIGDDPYCHTVAIRVGADIMNVTTQKELEEYIASAVEHGVAQEWYYQHDPMTRNWFFMYEVKRIRFWLWRLLGKDPRK